MSRCALVLALVGSADTCQRNVTVGRVIIAGWTGRDPSAVEKHIAELEKLGVPRPRSVPTFYRVAANRITTANCIEVINERSSGEVEFVLLQQGGDLWVGVGSDHTDRWVETFDVGSSKQICDKPVAPRFWRYADVAPHWHELRLRSYIGSERVEYQVGSVASILDPTQLITAFGGRVDLEEGTFMFCGTLPVIGEVRPDSQFALELEDPVMRRTIQHAYRVESLGAQQP